MSENLAEIVHHCGEDAVIRRNTKKKLYLVCRGCGVLHYGGPKGQEYLQAEMDGLKAVTEAAEQIEAERAERLRPRPAEAHSSGLLIG